VARLSKSGLYFKSKENIKIGTHKIAIKIEGFYSRTFVESIQDSKIGTRKIAIKIEDSTKTKTMLNTVYVINGI